MTRISPKEKVTLSKDIVKKVEISEDFLVYGSKDVVVLKKLNRPSRKE